ncbi:type II toxin-antitoxin system PemK/MazF family toxin [Streptomyces sp. NBC_01142]|uniref:type II toxin-antitoxin system PemK/MazF family toxin n=1 Tax=Streptomyces sp. NBC_01142 TaxID=2975865 RepID=UPI0022518320|nr:type II toxin-antitoxin system PemK/MazF family toxin [Streptomyces sp. NBC_01142]MCX4823399.1 type II toxin-antitoxin system PemK/MazF family toxin [Streptomyces sp. NBC_01142]
MDTSWWLAVFAVVVIALVAAVVDGRGRSGSRRPGGRARPPGRPTGPRRGPKRRPQPGEIWWADVPYEDGHGSKDRPCLVLSVRGARGVRGVRGVRGAQNGTALVAKITSKYRDEKAGVISLPPGTVGDAHGRPSFLETAELREVAMWEFRRRVGVVDPTVWDQVRHLAV